jgi:hypothetical protein
VRLTTSHRKTLLLWNLNRGGQGPIWAVAPLDGLIVLCGVSINITLFIMYNLKEVTQSQLIHEPEKFVFFG